MNCSHGQSSHPLTNSPAMATPEAPTTDPQLAEFKKMSLQQLMDQEVTSVAKQPQSYADAPASVAVVTGDDIARAGAASIPEALRLADNMEVAQINSHDWAISTRGFDTALADKLLVLIDGRSVYTPLYGGVLWDQQDYLMADIDRIEAISGPGGTLWGANAVNGVVNIVSKSAQDTQGLYMEAGGGNELQDFTGVRYGGVLASNVFFRVYAKYFDRNSELLTNGESADDDWSMGQGGFRIDAPLSPQNNYTLQGDIYSGGNDAGPVGNEAFSGGNILGRWSHTFSDDSDMSLQSYYDRTYLAVPYPAYAPAPYFSGFPAGDLTDDLDTFDIDFQHHFHVADWNNVIWGLGYRFTHEVDEDVSIVRFVPPALDQNLFSGFLQDEIKILDNVFLTLGTKVEHNDYTGFEVEPNARLRWNPTPKQMVWGAVSRAVSTPTRYDEDLDVVSGLGGIPPPYHLPTSLLEGNPDFESETVIAYELGYRAEIGSKVSTSISTYYNLYNNLRSVSPTPTSADYPFPEPDIFENNLEGDTYGMEVSGNYQVLPNWRLHAGYDLIKEDIHVKPGQVDIDDARDETSDPEQQFQIRSSINLTRDVDFDTALRWVDELHLTESPTDGPAVGTVPSYFELNARLGWRVNKHVELSLVGENLLHNHHVEYGFPDSSQEEIVRSVYAKAVFTW